MACEYTTHTHAHIYKYIYISHTHIHTHLYTHTHTLHPTSSPSPSAAPTPPHNALQCVRTMHTSVLPTHTHTYTHTHSTNHKRDFSSAMGPCQFTKRKRETFGRAQHVKNLCMNVTRTDARSSVVPVFLFFSSPPSLHLYPAAATTGWGFLNQDPQQPGGLQVQSLGGGADEALRLWREDK